MKMDRIDEFLLQIGIPAHLKGFRYLRDALEITEKDPPAIDHMTGVLWPKIAEKNDTTWQQVERSIRHAIERAWKNGENEKLKCLFGNSTPMGRAQPPNKQFIATLALYMRRGEKQQ